MPAERGYLMRDWLALHGLSAAGCLTLLETTGRAERSLRAPAVAADPAEDGLVDGLPDGPGIWALVAEGLGAQLPALAPEIARTAQETIANFTPDRSRHPRAFTLRLERGARIYASLPIRGKPLDVVLIAHEFGHALQLHCSGDTAVPPILRETCAFLAENLVARHMQCQGHALAGAVSQCLAVARARDLGARRQALRTAVGRPDARYDYDWNYPPARILARQLSDTADTALALFRGEATVDGLRRDMHV